MNENEGDAIQAYGGNKSAGLRVRKALREIEMHCIDMRNALFDQPLRKNAAGRKKKAEDGEGGDPAMDAGKDGVDGQSDEDEDYDREIDSDVDDETRRPSSPTPPSEPGNEVHEYQFLKTDIAGVGERPWPAQGLQNLKPGMRLDLGGGQRQVPVQMSPPVHAHAYAQASVHASIHAAVHAHAPAHVPAPPMTTPYGQYEETTWPPSVVFLDRDRL